MEYHALRAQARESTSRDMIFLDDLVTEGSWSSWAVYSECRQYRYVLGRSWAIPGEPEVPFNVVMLNPSTADAIQDDATIRKCKGFAKRFGCNGLLVRNLFALRAKDPKELRKAIRRWENDPSAQSPWGHHNPQILQTTYLPTPEWAAWGAVPKAFRDHYQYSKNLLPQSMWFLGHTKSQDPRHPLMLGYDDCTVTSLWQINALEPTILSLSSRSSED